MSYLPQYWNLEAPNICKFKNSAREREWQIFGAPSTTAEMDICAHWGFCRKFNFIQFCKKQFSNAKSTEASSPLGNTEYDIFTSLKKYICTSKKPWVGGFSEGWQKEKINQSKKPLLREGWRTPSSGTTLLFTLHQFHVGRVVLVAATRKRKY